MLSVDEHAFVNCGLFMTVECRVRAHPFAVHVYGARIHLLLLCCLFLAGVCRVCVFVAAHYSLLTALLFIHDGRL